MRCAAAARAAEVPRVDRVVICTPDKDLAQCVRGTRVVQMNRRTREIRDEAGVVAKFGVTPESIPDYLALVGDASDGYPGLARLGREVDRRRAGASTAISKRFRRTGRPGASTPPMPAPWGGRWSRERDRAFLFRELATLRTDIPLFESIDELRWTGPTPAFAALAARFDAAITEPERTRRRPDGASTSRRHAGLARATDRLPCLPVLSGLSGRRRASRSPDRCGPSAMSGG